MSGVADRRSVLAAHQLLELLARNRTGVPLGRGEPLLLGCPRIGPHQAVIPPRRRHGHDFLSCRSFRTLQTRSMSASFACATAIPARRTAFPDLTATRKRAPSQSAACISYQFLSESLPSPCKYCKSTGSPCPNARRSPISPRPPGSASRPSTASSTRAIAFASRRRSGCSAPRRRSAFMPRRC